MKNLALLGGFLLACSAPAFGQAPDSPSQTPDSTRGQSSRSGRTERTETITGCLQQRGGKYVLMTNNAGRNKNSASSTTESEQQQGTQTRHHAREIELTGNDQELQTHVGHTVTVTGTLHHKSSMNQNNSGSSATEPNDKDPQAAQNNSQNTSGRSHATMRVDSVQMVSDSCRTSGGSSSPQ